MAFEKGKSGNPNGRPRRIDEAARIARMHRQEAIEALVQNLKDPNGSVRNAAANSLLERGYGKPKEYIELDAEHNHTVSQLPETDAWLGQVLGRGEEETPTPSSTH